MSDGELDARAVCVSALALSSASLAEGAALGSCSLRRAQSGR